MRKTIIVLSASGETKIKAMTRKVFAVNRTEDDFWVVTYIPTGRKAPGYFFSKKSAIAASQAARNFFPHPMSGNHFEEWKSQFKTEQDIYDAWFSQLVGFGVGEFLV